MESKEDINIGIRSVLNSSTVPLRINDLYRDYAAITGEPIPLRKLGFRCLYDYLKTIPNIVSLDEPDNTNSIVRAVVNEKTRHIVNFVRGQKLSKPSRYSRKPVTRRRGIPNDFVPLSLTHKLFDYLKNYPDGIHLSDFECIVEKIQRSMSLRCDFSYVLERISPYTVIEGDYISLMKSYLSPTSDNAAVPKRPNEVIVVSSDELTDDGSYLDFLSESNSDDEDPPARNVSDVVENAESPRTRSSQSVAESRTSSQSGIDLVSDTLIKNLYALLDENPNGIWLTDLAKKYEMKFGYSLNPQQHGFECVMDMVCTLKHVFHMMQYEKSGDRHLRDARKVQIEHEVAEEGELPKSVVNDIKKLMQKRDKPQLYTDELAEEFKKFYKKTLDPIEYGFHDMNGLLKALSDNESSTFRFKPVKQRTLMYLHDSNFEEKKASSFVQDDSALPDNIKFDIIPKEVCNYDYKLPVNPMLKELTRGKQIKVKIAEVYTPERFYLHFADDVRELNLMMDDLHQFYEMNGDNYEVFQDTIRRGMLCACPFYGDSKWHRVQIVTFRGTSDIKVRFFDYGTTAEVSISKLRYLHLDFAKLPPMSVRAKLTGIKPKVIESQKPGYSVEVGETFFVMANVDDLRAEILNADLVNQCLEVLLFAKNEFSDVIVIHEKLIEGGYVEKREIVNEIPPVISEPSVNNTQENNTKNRKKNRLPPGIPIPSNLNPSTPMLTVSQPSTGFNVEARPFIASSAAYSKSSVTASEAPPFTASSSTHSQTTFNVQAPPFSAPSSYSQTTFNVQAPPFSIPSSTFSVPSSIFVAGKPTPLNSRMNPMNPTFYQSTYPSQFPMQQPMFGPAAGGFMYSRPPNVPQYNLYTTYGASPAPNLPNPYDYCYPRPTTYFAPSAPKPPPGFNYTRPNVPATNAYFTGDALYSNVTPNVTKQKETPKEPEKNVPIEQEAVEDEKPAWILKLEKLRDVIEEKNVSPDTASARITQVINDINDSKSIKKESEVAPDILEDHVHHSPTKSEINDLTTKFHNLIAARTDVQKISESSAKSENDFSVKSEDRESTRDEIRSQKIEQLRMFVMLQNRNLRKT